MIPNWQEYLLPQGTSQHFQTTVSQFVDLDWGDTQRYVDNIMENRVASKLFDEMNILCVGESFISCKVRMFLNAIHPSGTDAPCLQPILHIMLAMGAEKVDAVKILDVTSERLSKFHYVVIKDTIIKHWQRAVLDRNGCEIVSWEWVKDCLISGRLVPIPQ